MYDNEGHHSFCKNLKILRGKYMTARVHNSFCKNLKIRGKCMGQKEMHVKLFICSYMSVNNCKVYHHMVVALFC